jgi:hypothetical protein
VEELFGLVEAHRICLNLGEVFERDMEGLDEEMALIFSFRYTLS